VFRIWDIKNQKWLTCNERYKVCKDLNIPHVPVLEVKTLKDFDLDRDKILLYAEGYTAAGHEREGVVFKSIDGDFHFKAVSNRYLLSLK
jgi:ATP-dependent RNA circularization protein (DNA/RNA ligase family)